MKCVLVDLDGCLADITHRLHFIKQQPPDYDQFFANVMDDKPIDEIIQLVDILSNEYIVIMSGRSDVCEKDTIDWLDRHDVAWHELRMRKEGDHRPDYVVKQEMLDEMEGYDPWLAIDDRDSIARVWRKNGIKTLVCDDWDSIERTRAKGNPNLYVMVGATGSGKTTWIQENLPNIYRVSSDDMRFYLTGDYKDQTHNDDVFKACHGVMNQLLLNGVDVVFDATNIKNKDRKAVVKAAPLGTNVYYIVIDRPLQEKIVTGGWRLEIPSLIEKHDQTFRSNLTQILEGDNLGVEVWDYCK